jgi:uncharacterized protein YdhG (YjbR/CyaY superfamily)
MNTASSPITTIDEYIAHYPKDVQERMEKLRKVIREEAPEAKEKIGYGIPTFTFHGNLVHFGGFKTHIGFFPASSPMEEFKSEVSKYQTGKGTLQFPLTEEIPWDLVRKIVRFRVKENLERGKKK